MIDRRDRFDKDWSKYKEEFLATGFLDYQQQQEKFKEWKADMVERVDKKNRREYGQIWDSWLLEYEPMKLQKLQEEFPIVTTHPTDKTLEYIDFEAVEKLQITIQDLKPPVRQRGLSWLETTLKNKGMCIQNNEKETNELIDVFLKHIALELGLGSVVIKALEQYKFDDGKLLIEFFEETIRPICRKLSRLVHQQYTYEVEEFNKIDEYPFSKISLREVPVYDPEPTQGYYRNDFKEQFKIALDVSRENSTIKMLSGDGDNKRIPRPNLKKIKEYNKDMFDDDVTINLIQQLEDRWEVLIEGKLTAAGRRKEIISKINQLLVSVGTDKDIIKNFIDYISKDHQMFLVN